MSVLCSSVAPVGQPVLKLDAAALAAGEAKFTDDLPIVPRTVFAAYVHATKNAAIIKYGHCGSLDLGFNSTSLRSHS